jgi:cysteine sulfinate desulfinase/cysteine desulfurase-like protein
VTGSQLKRQLEEGHRVLCNACDELGTERTWMLDALRVPPDLHACVLRFSFTDDVTKPQAMQVAQGLLDELAKL